MGDEFATEQAPPVKSYLVTMPDASHLPMAHINVINVRFSGDEFFVTLGLAVPPEFQSEAESTATETVEATPVFRFATSRTVMDRFIRMLVDRYNGQSAFLREQLRLFEEAEKENRDG